MTKYHENTYLLTPKLLLFPQRPHPLPMSRFSHLAILLLFAPFFSCKTNKLQIKSPSKTLEVRIFNQNQDLELELRHLNNSVANIDVGKFVVGNDTLGKAYQIEDITYASKNENWSPVYGERSNIPNNYQEVQLSLKDESFSPIQLIIRLYDEGLAFRYLFPDNVASLTALTQELTSFHFDREHEAWITERAQGMYEKKPISSLATACERPLVIQQNDTTYLAIGEAALVNFARMKLRAHEQKKYSLQVELEGEVDLKQAQYTTPWRYILVANGPAQLLEHNYFIQNLNEANQIEEVSWIKPGKVIREVTLTTQGGMACVDFAAKHNLQYVEFDAGWYGNEYDDASDATTISVDPKRSPGPLDLHHVIDYANNKGIGIILYVNRRALEKQLDEVLPLYKSWGIKGLKYGFVQTGSQEWTSWLHEAVRKAAEHQLMVDVHDDYRPTGYSRTYPNLMTQEGIRGDEESPSTEHTLITAFTRMIAGAGDNTNCYLASRVSEKMGGKAAQMAKAIVLYSPWQFLYWYDRPEGSPAKKGGAGAAQGIIRPDENLAFYDQLPVVWDDTRVLEGSIGAFATIARKSEGNWWVGSLTAQQDRTLTLPLSFLDSNTNYEATIYFQNEADLKKNQVQSEKLIVTQQSLLSRELVENTGLAIILKKLDE